MANDILNELDEALETIKTCLGTKHESDKTYTDLLKYRELLVKFLKQGSPEFINYSNKLLISSLHKPNKSPLDVSILETNLGWINTINPYKNKDDPAIKYWNPHDKEKKISEIKSSLKELNLEDLQDALAELLLEYHILKSEESHYLAEIRFLRNFFEDALQKKVKTSLSKQNGRNNTFNVNNQALTECLDEALKGIENIKPEHFLKFSRLVNRKYPSPPLIPKPRLSEADKNQSDESILITLDVSKRDSWPDSTLRKFFLKGTGIKPSSKKINMS